MKPEPHDSRASKKATTPNTNGELVEVVREAKQRAWLEQNRQAIEEYNKRVAEPGGLGALRRF